MRWKRSRRRGVSVGRIATGVVVLLATAFALAWRMLPPPVQWHEVGSERMRTPALDYGDEDVRRMFATMRSYRLSAFGELAITCSSMSSWPETYVLFRSGDNKTSRPRRITFSLSANDGEAMIERIDPVRWRVAGHHRRGLDAREAERFRDLLIEGGFGASPSALPDTRSCQSEFFAFESCVNGRYHASVLGCGPPQTGSLERLADEVEAFLWREPSAEPARQLD